MAQTSPIDDFLRNYMQFVALSQQKQALAESGRMGTATRTSDAFAQLMNVPDPNVRATAAGHLARLYSVDSGPLAAVAPHMTSSPGVVQRSSLENLFSTVPMEARQIGAFQEMAGGMTPSAVRADTLFGELLPGLENLHPMALEAFRMAALSRIAGTSGYADARAQLVGGSLEDDIQAQMLLTQARLMMSPAELENLQLGRDRLEFDIARWETELQMALEAAQGQAILQNPGPLLDIWATTMRFITENKHTIPPAFLRAYIQGSNAAAAALNEQWSVPLMGNRFMPIVDPDNIDVGLTITGPILEMIKRMFRGAPWTGNPMNIPDQSTTEWLDQILFPGQQRR